MYVANAVADAGAGESLLSLFGVKANVPVIDGDSDYDTGMSVVAGTGAPGWPTGLADGCKAMFTGTGSGT